MNDPYDLQRFVDAQGKVMAQVLAELEAGRKCSHWMWFVFPQVGGLGHSATAKLFAIGSRAEAEAYLDHDVLGPRLQTCTRLVNAVAGRSAREIFGPPDDLKFRSSMTLFSRAARQPFLFVTALDRYFGGLPDPATLRLLQA